MIIRIGACCEYKTYVSSEYFRAYDIRGKLSNLTPTIIRSIAHALAFQYKNMINIKLLLDMMQD